MRVRTRVKEFFGFRRTDSISKVENIEMNEDIMHPDGGKIDVFFKGKDSSGIITLRQKEAKELVEALKPLVSFSGIEVKRFKK